MVVKESFVLQYKETAKRVIQQQGVIFVAITIGCSIIASTVIIFFIIRQSKNISEPIQGIIDFTYKLNSEENPQKVMKELDNLQEGTDQIAKLVQFLFEKM